jgi:hypothetical protein
MLGNIPIVSLIDAAMRALGQPQPGTLDFLVRLTPEHLKVWRKL